MTATDTNLWEDLLLAIDEGHVVPIVGRDLLVVETDKGPCLFHHLIAERLAAQLKVPTENLPPGFDANDVVCAYEGFHGDPEEINIKVVHILRDLKVPVPAPIRLLAEIPKFKLFVSTSYDTLLEEALTAVRRQPAVVAFPPTSSLTDFDEALMEKHGSLVFQVLGRVSGSAPFAVTEGQVLEQMHGFMTGRQRPEKLIERLCNSHLLMLGVSFPDWLARFLLRLARAKPLWDARVMMEFIADTGAQQEFSLFLRHFSPKKSRLFTGGSPLDFVRELHRRWFECYPRPGGGGPPPPPADSEKPAEMVRGSIFISYASEDRNAAFGLADAMTNAGLEVWVDRRLNPGDDYRNIIERHIRDCCAFVPVLSSHTQKEDQRYFRKEWAQACEQAKSFFGLERRFLFPVVVDDTPMSELNEIRRETFGRSAIKAVKAASGEAPVELIGQLDRAQKDWRKQYTRA